MLSNPEENKTKGLINLSIGDKNNKDYKNN